MPKLSDLVPTRHQSAREAEKIEKEFSIPKVMLSAGFPVNVFNRTNQVDRSNSQTQEAVKDNEREVETPTAMSLDSIMHAFASKHKAVEPLSNADLQSSFSIFDDLPVALPSKPALPKRVSSGLAKQIRHVNNALKGLFDQDIIFNVVELKQESPKPTKRATKVPTLEETDALLSTLLGRTNSTDTSSELSIDANVFTTDSHSISM